MVKRYPKLTSWSYRGIGEVISGNQIIAVKCHLSQREHMVEIEEMGMGNQPLAGVERREYYGQVTVISDDKNVLTQIKSPLELRLLELEGKPVFRMTHKATRRDGVYDIVEKFE